MPGVEELIWERMGLEVMLMPSSLRDTSEGKWSDLQSLDTRRTVQHSMPTPVDTNSMALSRWPIALHYCPGTSGVAA